MQARPRQKSPRLIAAQVFDGETERRVAREVAARDETALQVAARVKPVEDREQDQVRGCLEQLRGDHRQTLERGLCDQGRGGCELFPPGGRFAGKGDPDAGMREFSVAAPVHKAADPAERMAERDHGQYQVGDLKQVLAIDARAEQQHEGGGDEPAVEHQPALIHPEHAEGIAREFRRPVLKHVGGAGSDHGGKHQPRQQRGETVRVLPRAFAEPYGGLPAEEESQRHAKSIRAQSEGAKLEKGRMHGGYHRNSPLCPQPK